MGCWNETCALTHTPITEGEECYMIVVPRHMFKDDDSWQLEFPRYSWLGTFKGSYNDYGWLDNLDEKVGEYEYDQLVRVFICMEAAEYAFTRFRSEVISGYHYKNAVEMTKLFADLDKISDNSIQKQVYPELAPLYIETMCFVHLAQMNRMNMFGASTSQMRSESYEYAIDLWKIAKKRYESLIVEENEWDRAETTETTETED